MPKTPFNSHKSGKEPKFKKCPPFEETVISYIENEADKKRALDFAGWLRKSKLSPLTGNNGYNWYINFKYVDYNNCEDGKYYRGTYHGCYIKMFNDTWHILPSKDILEQMLLREDLKEVIWDSIFPCYGCNYGCFKYTHNTEYKKKIFSREFTGKGICLRNPICLSNPNDKTLDVLKEVLLARKDSKDLEIKANMNIYNYGIK
jgi:hypothetical protein